MALIVDMICKDGIFCVDFDTAKYVAKHCKQEAIEHGHITMAYIDSILDYYLQKDRSIPMDSRFGWEVDDVVMVKDENGWLVKFIKPKKHTSLINRFLSWMKKEAH